MDKAWLENQYIDSKKSAEQIGRELGVHPSSVSYWLKKHQIPKRTMSDCIHIKNDKTFDNSAIEIINGLLLGDGHISSIKRSARYVHTSSKKDYLIWLTNLLKTKGLEFGEISSKMIDSFNTGKPHMSHRVASKSYKLLKSIHQSWYTGGVKSIPTDLVLTPTTILHWYIGDGCLHRVTSKTNKKYYSSVFYTNGFSLKDVELLIEKLKAVNIDSHWLKCKRKNSLKNEYKIVIGNQMTEVLLNLIGKCPEDLNDVYGYKWSRKPVNWSGDLFRL